MTIVADYAAKVSSPQYQTKRCWSISATQVVGKKNCKSFPLDRIFSKSAEQDWRGGERARPGRSINPPQFSSVRVAPRHLCMHSIHFSPPHFFSIDHYNRCVSPRLSALYDNVPGPNATRRSLEASSAMTSAIASQMTVLGGQSSHSLPVPSTSPFA